MVLKKKRKQRYSVVWTTYAGSCVVQKIHPSSSMGNMCYQDRAANMMQLRCSRIQVLRPNYTAMKEAEGAITQDQWTIKTIVNDSQGEWYMFLRQGSQNSQLLKYKRICLKNWATESEKMALLLYSFEPRKEKKEGCSPSK